MKQLIKVDNTHEGHISGEGHISLRFKEFDPKETLLANFDRGMINVSGDEETGEVSEIEVLFVNEPGRLAKLVMVADLYDLDISPLFSTYQGSLAA